MQKLFVDFTPQGTFSLDEQQSRHIAGSLRMKRGDMLTLSCGDGNDYGCIIDDTSKLVQLTVCYSQPSESEADVRVHLYQGVPKGNKLDDIVRECTQLGVAEITPVLTARSVSRPDEKSAKAKNVRYNKISLEASQQSGRGIVPVVHNMISLEQAVAQDNSTLKILFYEGGGTPIKNIVKKGIDTVSVYIGAEGGFEASEVDMLVASGAKLATLGKRILRCETAPLVALTAVMLLSDNLN